jgi:hypothetical protein
MTPIINSTWRYRYVGRNPNLKGQICYGCRNSRTGKRIWSGGPGPRNALVWFVESGQFVVVPGRSSLRKEPPTARGD